MEQLNLENGIEPPCKCADCGIPIEGDNTPPTEVADGDMVCPDCKDNYSLCDDCEKLFSNDNGDLTHYERLGEHSGRYPYTACGKTLCSNCEDAYPVCSDCSERHDSDTSHEVSGRPICDKCIDEYSCCESCGEWVSSDYAIFNERLESTYCQGCAPSEYDEEVDSDHTFRNGTPTEEFPFMRHVSLELEAVDGDPSGLYDTLPQRGHGIKMDGSLSGENDREVNTPIVCGHLVGEAIGEATRALRNAGYSVDSECGTHLHVNVNDLSVKELGSIMRNYLLFEPVFTRLVEMRHRGRYAKSALLKRAHTTKIFQEESAMWVSPRYEKYDAIWKLTGLQDRYYALNMGSAYAAHGSFEWRLFEGLLCDADLQAMSYLLAAFIDKAHKWHTFVPSKLEVLKHGTVKQRLGLLFWNLSLALQLPKWVTDWMVKRYEEFGATDLTDGDYPKYPIWISESAFIENEAGQSHLSESLDCYNRGKAQSRDSYGYLITIGAVMCACRDCYGHTSYE